MKKRKRVNTWERQCKSVVYDGRAGDERARLVIYRDCVSSLSPIYYFALCLCVVLSSQYFSFIRFFTSSHNHFFPFAFSYLWHIIYLKFLFLIAMPLHSHSLASISVFMWNLQYWGNRKSNCNNKTVSYRKWNRNKWQISMYIILISMEITGKLNWIRRNAKWLTHAKCKEYIRYV